MVISHRGNHGILDWSSHMIKTPGDIQGFITPGEPNAHTTLLVVQPVAPD
ncbi:hypothetical protein [Corynebacterium atrinae]